MLDIAQTEETNKWDDHNNDGFPDVLAFNKQDNDWQWADMIIRHYYIILQATLSNTGKYFFIIIFSSRRLLITLINIVKYQRDY